jgi:RES domain-containing protein
VPPQFAHDGDIISGVGSQISGGRWNAPGSFRAVYLADSPETAMAEVLAHYRYYSIPIEQALPRVFVAVNVDLRSVLDLRDGIVRNVLRTSKARLIGDRWRELNKVNQESLCQVIGRAAYETGLEGLIVPSVANPGGFNLVVLPERLSHAGMGIDQPFRELSELICTCEILHADLHEDPLGSVIDIVL